MSATSMMMTKKRKRDTVIQLRQSSMSSPTRSRTTSWNLSVGFVQLSCDSMLFLFLRAFPEGWKVVSAFHPSVARDGFVFHCYPFMLLTLFSRNQD
jgi:hypothetical protein